MSLPWTDENREQFVQYITEEFRAASAERGDKEAVWQKWRRMREAEPLDRDWETSSQSERS